MADYWVSFRIENDRAYEERYQAFREAIDKATTKYWAETTSFYLASSHMEIDQFARVISAPLLANKDKLVVRYLAKDGSIYYGKIDHLDILKQFLPNIKKLG